MFQGKNIFLRALEPQDLDVICKWENNPDIWHLSTTLVPYSRHILKKYIDQAQLDIYSSKQLRLVICLNDHCPIGCIDLFDFDPYHLRAGVAILIANDAERKKGHASESLQLLINYSFKHLHLNQLFCNILEDNEASIKLFSRQGFNMCGTKKKWIRKEDKWLDEHTLQLLAYSKAD